ncbi:hypothetical protein Vafri_13699 [Volvox africanus]|uniref:Uncharacterized protein n=1 Tax=Volvox africanus TaxID=51714 RepID=A0A8J4BHQ1_9CHLO|nr:hypothetical protein Vafri_13699 [Volvox africanus]
MHRISELRLPFRDPLDDNIKKGRSVYLYWYMHLAESAINAADVRAVSRHLYTTTASAPRVSGHISTHHRLARLERRTAGCHPRKSAGRPGLHWVQTPCLRVGLVVQLRVKAGG